MTKIHNSDSQLGIETTSITTSFTSLSNKNISWSNRRRGHLWRKKERGRNKSGMWRERKIGKCKLHCGWSKNNTQAQNQLMKNVAQVNNKVTELKSAHHYIQCWEAQVNSLNALAFNKAQNCTTPCHNPWATCAHAEYSYTWKNHNLLETTGQTKTLLHFPSSNNEAPIHLPSPKLPPHGGWCP